MTDSRPPMSHATGAPVADNLNIMTAGPGNLFRKMTSALRQLLFDNTARAMGVARLNVK